jgi:hypothetical protein
MNTPTQSLQPSSPTTTLRNSILAAEAESEKVKNNLKSTRKQHKITLDRLQSQIDRESSKLSNTGGTDDRRQRQRLKQLETSVAKMSSEQQSAEQHLEDLGSIPPEEKQSYDRAMKEARDRQRRTDIQKSSFAKGKKEADKKVASATNELQSLLNKRGKMEGKQKDKAALLVDVGKKKDQAAQAKTIRSQEKANMETRLRQESHDMENHVVELERQYQQELKTFSSTNQSIQHYQEFCHRMQSGHSAPGTPEGQSALPVTSVLMSNNIGTTSLPCSRPTSLHISHSGLNHGFQFPAPIGSGLSLHGRKRSSSLEIDFNGLHPPPGLTSSFSPASSSALLANSTALSPQPSHSLNGTMPFPSFTSYAVLPPIPAPVGAEKESRRKGSAGSHGSFKGMNGTSENGSPRFGKTNGVDPAVNGVHHHHGKLGMVSPPSSAIWERKANAA